MPVNMPTHAHGQGYTDLNFLIPELVARIDYRKGPYFADEGDFSSAGAAHIDYVDRAATRPRSARRSASNGYARVLVAGSPDAGGGHAARTRSSSSHNDGPWVNPENFTQGQRRAALQPRRRGATATASPRMAYDGKWNATDQIPQRAVDARADRPLRRDRSDRRRRTAALQPVATTAQRALGDGAVPA